MRKTSVVISLLAALLLITMVGDTFAGFYARIEDQQRKIDHGVRRGQLTHDEAETLQGNLNWIRHEFERAWADGRLNHHEARRLEKMLDQNEEMIYRKKHNTIRRFY